MAVHRPPLFHWRYTAFHILTAHFFLARRRSGLEQGAWPARAPEHGAPAMDGAKRRRLHEAAALRGASLSLVARMLVAKGGIPHPQFGRFYFLKNIIF